MAITHSPGIAVVIGGGNGIGAACCRLMRGRGWTVVTADNDAVAARAIAAETEGYGFEVDVRDAYGLDIELWATLTKEAGIERQ